VCHVHGNPNSYNAAISFLEANRLIRFYTSLYAPAGLKRRFHSSLPRARVTTHPLREAARLCAAHLPLKGWGGQRQWFVDFVSRDFDEWSARQLEESDSAVYCYEDSAFRTFTRAEKLGVRRIYELPILYYREMRRLFQPEVDRLPELGRFFQSFREPQEKLERKDQELQKADVIVVPSTFVRRSVERFLNVKAKFVVAPYGADTSTTMKAWSEADQRGPLRLLFVGSLGPRKGVHHLFESISSLPPRSIHLTLIGHWDLGFREWIEARFPMEYQWLGPVTKNEVHAAYRDAHVLVFPSLAEGFALVISEAMASGIPVITTERTAGYDLFEQEQGGWLVAAGDPEALRAKIEYLLENRDILPDVGLAGRRKAEQSSWTRYRKDLRDGIETALEW
jgi:glycosyltransferase involved in cell wall biosynthesis